MVILKRIFGGKFSVEIRNPKNVCFSYTELEMSLPHHMDNLTYQQAVEMRYKLRLTTDKLGLKVVIK